MVSDVVGGGAALGERARDIGWWTRTQVSESVIWQTALLRPVQQLYMSGEAYILGLHLEAVSHVNERHFDGWYGDRPANLPT